MACLPLYNNVVDRDEDPINPFEDLAKLKVFASVITITRRSPTDSSPREMPVTNGSSLRIETCRTGSGTYNCRGNATPISVIEGQNDRIGSHNTHLVSSVVDDEAPVVETKVFGFLPSIMYLLQFYS